MSFLGHRQIYQSDMFFVSGWRRSPIRLRPRSHRLDEFAASYSSAGRTPALPASALPAGFIFYQPAETVSHLLRRVREFSTGSIGNFRSVLTSVRNRGRRFQLGNQFDYRLEWQLYQHTDHDRRQFAATSCKSLYCAGRNAGNTMQLHLQDWGKVSALGANLAGAQPGSAWYWDGDKTTASVLSAMNPAIKQSYYQSLMAATYAIGSYLPVCYLCPGPANWGKTPIWQQPRSYTVNDPDWPCFGCTQRVQPFNFPWYVLPDCPRVGLSVPIPSRGVEGNDCRHSTTR